jgi:hypothetical protein
MSVTLSDQITGGEASMRMCTKVLPTARLLSVHPASRIAHRTLAWIGCRSMQRRSPLSRSTGSDLNDGVMNTW